MEIIFLVDVSVAALWCFKVLLGALRCRDFMDFRDIWLTYVIFCLFSFFIRFSKRSYYVIAVSGCGR